MENYTRDRCFRLVADERRRRVIQYVRHEPRGVTTIDEVVEELRRTGDGEMERAELTIQLHHSHLPKLADAGILEYDHASGAIRYRGDERIERLLRSLSGAVPASKA